MKKYFLIFALSILASSACYSKDITLKVNNDTNDAIQARDTWSSQCVTPHINFDRVAGSKAKDVNFGSVDLNFSTPWCIAMDSSRHWVITFYKGEWKDEGKYGKHVLRVMFQRYPNGKLSCETDWSPDPAVFAFKDCKIDNDVVTITIVPHQAQKRCANI